MPRSGWLAVGAAGAALVIATGLGALVVAVAAAGLAAVAIAIRGGRRRAVLAIAIGLAAVALRCLVAPPPSTPTDVALEGRGPWLMTVEAVGSPREGRQTATLALVDDAGMVRVRVAATMPRFPVVTPGDVLEVTGRPRPRPDSPYGAYLERIGAWGTLTVDTLGISATRAGPSVALERFRRSTGDALTRVLSEPEAGLAAGILIGLRDRVDREVAAAFTTAGVSHVVAISGWNIAIVAAAVTAVAGGIARRRRALVTVIAITAYIAFAGASPSVVRAGTMAGVVLFARETGRAGHAAAALGWAATLLLLADPRLVGDAGFQLSTLATAGLIAWATPLSERIGRLAGGRVPRWLAESLGVSLAAQAATMPVVLASFGRLAVIAPAVNLAVVPLVPPSMAAGVVALAGGLLTGWGLPGVVGALLAAPCWIALRLMIAIVDAMAALPFASVSLPPPAGAIAGLGCAALLVAVIARGRGRRHAAGGAPTAPPAMIAPVAPDRRSAPTGRSGRAARLAAIGLVVVVAVTAGIVAMRPAGVARLIVLDVGQGDAILIEGAHGGRMLIDGGPDADRTLVALDRRIPPWDRRIDIVVLTHPHEDHVAGLVLVLDRYRVGQVVEPGMRGPGPSYRAWSAALQAPDAPRRRTLATGDRLAIDGIAFAVLWPDRGSVPTEPGADGSAINRTSIVLVGEAAGHRFLLTGDIEEDVDPSLVARGLPDIDILKVAHHGSRTATTGPFIAATTPAIAIASAGADNTYGHPSPETLDRLEDVGSRVFRTDRDGTVTVHLDPGGLGVAREPRRGASAPAAPSGRRALGYHRPDAPIPSRHAMPATRPSAPSTVVAWAARRRRSSRPA